MGFRIGHGYMGSSNLQTSTANQELVPSAPEGWINSKLYFYKFSFDNGSDCHVKINGGSPIYLKAGQGFEMNEIDAQIYSFVIVESGIQFNWIGTY